MNHLKSLLKDLMDKFPFIIEVTDSKGETLIKSKNIVPKSSEYFSIEYNEELLYIEIDKEYYNSIPLIRYLLEDKLNQLSLTVDNILVSILENNPHPLYTYKDIIKKMNSPSIMIIKTSLSLDKVIDILKASYGSKDYHYCKWNNYPMILGDFVDVHSHCESILETLSELTIKKSIICYEELTLNSDIPKIVNNLIDLMRLCEKLNLRKNILTYNSIIFENIMDNISPEIKYKLLDKYKDFFDSLDGATIQTIDTFLDMDLNISNTSKALYVHRNTLIYRLDKIKNDINLDLRNFKDALTFSSLYFIWKSLR
ncbi:MULTISPECIES: PucR family transcriptional regulator [unclassified Clostridium]|uniref:PucR family transcriptional regulator n=1 Tax=unclassified Clostridium TaxID=2614128 RepID=UPI001EEE6605|nr:helix-turn-helix domain-containing protein [Clostridium sp. UBA1652]